MKDRMAEFPKKNDNKGTGQKMQLSNALEAAAEKAGYDAQAKKILSNKIILAWILKYAAQEFRQFPIKKIVDSIEGTPEVSVIPVYPGKVKPEAVTGMSNSDTVPNEGEVTFDIRFYVYTPERERIKLIVNVEAQKKYHVDYDLVTRGIFYCARMLSAQLDTEFTGKDYDQIKKVYSIWICMNAPKYAANTITEYKIEPNMIYGEFGGNARYDLLSVVMICLSEDDTLEQKDILEPEDILEQRDISEREGVLEQKEALVQEDVPSGAKLLGVLATVLSEDLTPEAKEDILEKDYGIATSVEMKEDMRLMCNLSDLIEERGIRRGVEQGIERGIEQGIEQGIERGIKALVETCKELGISQEDTQARVEKKFALTENKAKEIVTKFWK